MKIVVNSSHTMDDHPIPPDETLEAIPPPGSSLNWMIPPEEKGQFEEEVEESPLAYKPNPVSSVHTIDTASDPPKVSTLDSAVVTPEGSIIHGRYGEFTEEAVSGIPLEFLALLHPAAEGVAALRTLKASSGSKKGTLLVYGASEAAGMATTQIATADGHAVVGVIAGNHSGNDQLNEIMKAIIMEPGVAIPEEYALVKKNFQDLVGAISNGDDPLSWSNYNGDMFLEEFQSNLLDYAAFYPDPTKSTIDAEKYQFKGKEKDRTNYDANISAYLDQFTKGSPAIDPELLKEKFNKDYYAAFKDQFHKQMTANISDDKDSIVKDWNSAVVANKMLSGVGEVAKKEDVASGVASDAEDYIPYHFSPTENKIGNGVEIEKGGPVLGAVIAVTSDLKVAVEAVAKAKTLRDKAEALVFLTEGQQNAFAGASSVMYAAKKAGVPTVVVGGELPGLESVTPSKDDVSGALSAMDLDDEGNAKLNFFVQLYRASDYPVYADYAIHRATEDLSGPRQILVAK